MTDTVADEAIVRVRMDVAVDEVLDVLELAEQNGVEVDPLATIVDRLRARGGELDLEGLPPVMRMLLSGILE